MKSWRQLLGRKAIDRRYQLMNAVVPLERKLFMNRLLMMTLATVLIVSGPIRSRADETADSAGQAKLASRTYGILKNRCYRCHGGQKRIENLDVLNRTLLTEQNNGDGEEPSFYIVPEKPDDSTLWSDWVSPDSAAMPKVGSAEAKAMTDDERDVIRQWIEAGAANWGRDVPEPVTSRQMLEAMRDFLFRSKADDRKKLRFFTMAHLYNNGDKVSHLELRLYRAALSKLVNSLSTQRKIILP